MNTVTVQNKKEKLSKSHNYLVEQKKEKKKLHSNQYILKKKTHDLFAQVTYSLLI